MGDFKIGRVLHLKSEIRNIKLDCLRCPVQSEISDFGFEMQDSSNFEMFSFDLMNPGFYRTARPYTMLSSRAILSSSGGCVLKRFTSPPPRSGLTINM